ncbi:ABC transporter permease/M1 family aminopeptidase [Aquimarina algiphila]|uniref:ABC transporter permease/M1 family aminopeptidase n=1 Tax=Aquimarina algiphila TaxID=2047982 RepID=UPI00232DABB4|nr:M1 family aminopeptidase [Aquimarina algiphila]
MMWYEIFKFEIKYRAKRPDTYIYFAIVFLFSLIAVNFIFEKGLNPVKENAPYVIAFTMAVVTAIFTMITSMIMGVAALRDFDHNMESLMFINPIKKKDYLLGRFLGSFVVLLFIYSGLLFGIMLGEFMPWRDTDNMLTFNLWHYLQPFLYLVIPNLFCGGVIFFISGALSRKLIVVYTQGIIFFVLYQITAMLTKGRIDDPFFVTALDPFSFQTINTIVRFWTTTERNLTMVPMDGLLLYNRLIWVIIGIVVFIVGAYKFSFNVVRDKGSKKKSKAFQNKEKKSLQEDIEIPKVNIRHDIKANFIQLKHHTFFYLRSILKEGSFLAILLCGIGIIFINSIDLGNIFGVNSYPSTYLVIEELQEMSMFFFLILLVFYSGELIWKERDVKLNLIHDSLPISDFINLTGKFLGLLLMYLILIVVLIVSGIVFQISKGYYQVDLVNYTVGFFGEIFPFLMLFSFISFFFQTICNHKYIGHLMVLIFFIVTLALLILGFNHGLYSFGGGDLGTYSDMNGYGHFPLSYSLFKVYWIAICMLIFIITVVFSVRGTETQLKKRLKLGQLRLNSSLIKLGTVAMFIFITTGCYIFYNTNILNTHFSISTKETYKANYEKTLKRYEYLPQPKIVDVNLKVELYPKERNYTAEGYFILKNKHNTNIKEIHIQKLANDDVVLEDVYFNRGVSISNEFEEFSYYVYTLDQPLVPGDSLKMEFKQTYTTKGFEGDNQSNTQIVYNGTFFNNDHFPTLGYNKSYELKDNNTRRDYGLSPRMTKAKIDDPKELMNGRSGGDGYKINFEMVIGTEADQTAITSGTLKKEWIEGDRKYFHYKMDTPMINFYAVVSARYEVKKDQWIPKNDSLGDPVDLEIYYHKGHEYNLDRMMKSMKASFDYFSTNFSPYQDHQMRIMEFPRYETFAQSFPSTVPFSEAIGFMMDIDDEKDVDMTFYITAHELAHQWWGLQLVAANVEGRHMILESLAQYSALMVMKQVYSEEKIQQFLKGELERYLSGRTSERKKELPLALVEGQQYIHYGKGALNLYAFQDYISEEKVNLALRRFIRDWNGFNGQLQTDRYATTADLLGYFREVTPDHLQYIIMDLFETITLYENKTTEARYTTISKDQYRVNLTLDAVKYRIDSLGVEKSISINDWVDIGIYADGKNGKDKLIYLKKHKITNQITQLELTVNQKPTKAGIDPKYKLIDRKTKNNVLSFSE